MFDKDALKRGKTGARPEVTQFAKTILAYIAKDKPEARFTQIRIVININEAGEVSECTASCDITETNELDLLVSPTPKRGFNT